MFKSPMRSILALCALLLVFSCKDDGEVDPPKTPEELAIQDLTGSGTLTWVIAGGGSVTRDGRNETNIYQTFELTLNSAPGKTYTSINGADLFDAGGSWAFVTGSLDKIILDGSKPASKIPISFTRTGDNLILTFSIVAPSGRTLPNGAVAGNYTFTLRKKA
jgi:hypothetical protein